MGEGDLTKKLELTLFNFEILKLVLNFCGRRDTSNLEAGTVVLCHIVLLKYKNVDD